MLAKVIPLFGQFFLMSQHQLFNPGTPLAMVTLPKYRPGYDISAPMTLRHSLLQNTLGKNLPRPMMYTRLASVPISPLQYQVLVALCQFLALLEIVFALYSCFLFASLYPILFFLLGARFSCRHQAC